MQLLIAIYFLALSFLIRGIFVSTDPKQVAVETVIFVFLFYF